MEAFAGATGRRAAPASDRTPYAVYRRGRPELPPFKFLEELKASNVGQVVFLYMLG